MEKQIEESAQQRPLEKELRIQEFSCHGEDLFSDNEHEQMVKNGHETGSSGSRQRKKKKLRKQCNWDYSDSSSSSDEEDVSQKLKFMQKCERKRNKEMKEWVKMMMNGKHHLPSQPQALSSQRYLAPMEVLPKFRRQEKGEDIIVFLEGFEAHQSTYGINLSQWSARLAPLLLPEVLAVFQSMKVEDRRIFAKVWERLLKYYHVSRMTFARKIDDVERKPGYLVLRGCWV